MHNQTHFLMAFFVILLVGTACASGSDRHLVANGAEEAAIGTLVLNKPLGLANPSEYALDDGLLYAGPRFRVNGINLKPGDGQNIDSLAGKLVYYRYVPRTDLFPLLEKRGPVPARYGEAESMQQLRSDWVAAETGFTIGRSTIARLRMTPWHQVLSIEPFNGLEVKEEDDTVVVRFRNVFATPLESLRITAHYESTSGKPNPAYGIKEFATLAPTASVSVTFRRDIDSQHDGRLARYQSVHVHFTTAGKMFRLKY